MVCPFRFLALLYSMFHQKFSELPSKKNELNQERTGFKLYTNYFPHFQEFPTHIFMCHIRKS